jgi:hypothetical protein
MLFGECKAVVAGGSVALGELGAGVRSSGGVAVLVDEPTETVDPLDSVEPA